MRGCCIATTRAARHRARTPCSSTRKAPKIPLKDYAYNETRFQMLTQSKPQEAERLMELAQQDVNERWRMYEQLASLDYGD